LQSKFFPAKILFCILEKGILAGKNLLCKEGYSMINLPTPLFDQSKIIIKFRPQTPTAHQPLPNCSNTMDTQRNFLIKNRTSFSMFGQRKSLEND
jgi:hypothetical protein